MTDTEILGQWDVLEETSPGFPDYWLGVFEFAANGELYVQGQSAEEQQVGSWNLKGGVSLQTSFKFKDKQTPSIGPAGIELEYKLIDSSRDSIVLADCNGSRTVLRRK